MEVKTFPGSAVTEIQLQEAAALFSDNYGIWGKESKRAGQRVALSPARLREQCLPGTAESSVYVRSKVNGILAGHVFACRWHYKGLQVCWITQMVVHKDFRDTGLATTMLCMLRQTTDNIYGIMSSHPAACLAAARAFGRGIENISLDLIASHADQILESSPIAYIRDAKLHGTLFNDESMMVSGVDTGFFVDHDEPMAALEMIQSDYKWPLGNLEEGHEFLLLIAPRHNSLQI